MRSETEIRCAIRYVTEARTGLKFVGTKREVADASYALSVIEWALTIDQTEIRRVINGLHVVSNGAGNLVLALLANRALSILEWVAGDATERSEAFSVFVMENAADEGQGKTSTIQ